MRTTGLAFRILMLHNIFISILIELDVATAESKSKIFESEKLTLEEALEMRHQKMMKRDGYKRVKEEAAKDIRRNISPGKLMSQGNFTSIIMEHDGEPMPLYILLIAMIPLVLAELCRTVWNLIRPKLKVRLEGGGEFPFTACSHLQESLRERSLKRTARNCISWFVHQYILSIEDETLEWKDVINSLQVSQAQKKPWHTIRLMFRMRNALKQDKSQFVEEGALNRHNLASISSIGDDLDPRSAVMNALHLDSQISQLELQYKTLNAMEKDYEVPSRPHPQLFTVRELMEFMTRDEKLLVLRCFDKSQMDQLMIHCNMENIRKKHGGYFQAYMEATTSEYDHVDEMDTKASADKKEPSTQVSAAKVGGLQKSLQTLFDLKDQLAKEIVEENDKLLEDWENNEKQNKISPELEPLYIKSHKFDLGMEPVDIFDEFFIQEQPEELKVKPVTSEEIIEQLIKKAALDIDYIEKRIEVKKKRKKGKSKITVNMNTKKKDILAHAEKGEGETDDKAPFNWQRKSDDKDDIAEMLDTLPKLKHHDQGKGKHHKKLHKLKNQDNATGNKGRRNTAENEAKEEHPKVPGEHEAKEKRKISGSENEFKNKEKRKISGSENESKNKEQRKISGSENGSKDKERRKISGGESGEKPYRKLSGNEHEKRKTSGEDTKEKKKSRISGDEPSHEHRQLSEDESEEKGHQSISNEEQPRTSERKRENEAGDRGRRKLSEDERKERERQKSNQNKRRESEQRRISENERIENEKRKFSENDQEKEGGKDIPENDANIQAHHHHHKTQNLPKLILDQHHQQENSHGNFGVGDDSGLQYSQNKYINVVHDASVKDFLTKTENKDLTKSEVMAIERDTLFKESKDHPQIKIYSQGRRTHFDELLHELMKPNKDSDKSPGDS